MKTKFLLIVLAVLALGAGTLVVMRPGDSATETAHEQGSHRATPHDKVSHTATKAAPRVPAYQLAAEARNLPATLAASQFVGKAREAYEVAKEIPQTLAQLPCYCECDKAFGHKSLHTCFVDDHASHCAVCVDEALLAYKLQKDQRLTPEQVREKIVEKYSVD